MFCPECGTKIEGSLAFCPDCGASIPKNPPSASPLSPVNGKNVILGNTDDAPDKVIGDRNNVMGDVTGKKISADSYAEKISNVTTTTHQSSTDNSQHITYVTNGVATQEYCGVCGIALGEVHVKCPECGKKICPSCKVEGKNRCKACEQKAKDEYRLEYRQMLLEMDGSLNSFARRVLDEKARKMNLVAEKAEIEKEFESLDKKENRCGGFNVKVATAPEEVLSNVIPLSKGTPESSSLGSSTVATRGVGSLVGSSISVTPSCVAESTPSSAENNQCGWTVPEEAEPPEKPEESVPEPPKKNGGVGVIIAVIAMLAVAGGVGAFFLFGKSEESTRDVATREIREKEDVSSVHSRKRVPVPETFRIAEISLAPHVSAWAKKKIPDAYSEWARAEKTAAAANVKMLEIARRLEGKPGTQGTYPENPEFLAAKSELSNAESAGRSLCEKISEAYKLRPLTKPYTIVRGDTPTKICAKNKVTMEKLKELNPGVDFSSALKLKVGQVVVVPVREEE